MASSLSMFLACCLCRALHALIELIFCIAAMYPAAAAQNQNSHTIGFLASEAKDTAQEITKEGEEKFLIEIHGLTTEQRDKSAPGLRAQSKRYRDWV